MPKISINYWDLVHLVGRELSIKELEDIFPNIKCEWVSSDGETIELETTHERPDLISTEGIARALRAYLGIESGLKQFKFKRSGLKAIVDKSVIPERPHSRMFIVKDVSMTSALIEQLMQMQEKLHLIYTNNRRDASIGVYDLDTFKWPITYCAKDDYRFVPLGETEEMSCKEVLEKTEKGREYAHLIGKKYPLIIDAEGKVLSMPPILNSEDTKLTAETKNLFVDVSGMDEKTVEKIATLMAVALAERGNVETVTMEYPKRKIESPELKTEVRKVSHQYINKLLGTSFDTGEMVRLLEKMGFGAKAEGNNINVRIPCYRFDVLHDCDIAEEIAIAYGYNRLEPILPKVSTIGRRHPVERLSEQIREIMIGAGFQEVLTYILCSKELMEKANFSGFVEIINPVSEEYNCVRNSLIPRHLDVLHNNKHHPLPHKIFEVEDCVEVHGNKTETVRKLCVMMIDHGITFTNMKSLLQVLMKNLGYEYSISEIKHPAFLEGRTGKIKISGKDVGIIGEVHPEVLNRFELKHPVVAMEINIEKIIERG
ncbi:MAG: phenylalanine--tRNA ligase subunit beta [Candidatus Diapherotrites archaeon]|nr:phenylalanine--tRNA ligase subunit beta [Candidatus Diapherotrites archaeon]